MNGEVTLPLAFLAGVAAFFTPCFLPLIPVYLGYLSNLSLNTPQRIGYTFLNALLFVLGFTIIFTALGASVGFVGHTFVDQMPMVRKVVGVLLGLAGIMVLFGPLLVKILPCLSWFYRGGSIVSVSFKNRGGYVFSFLLGVSFSLAWSPCIGPMLGVILTLAYDSATVEKGTVFLAVFSAGLAIPFLISALLINQVSNIFNRISRVGRVVEWVTGAGLILFGFLVYTDSLVKLNSWFESFNFAYRWA